MNISPTNTGQHFTIHVSSITIYHNYNKTQSKHTKTLMYNASGFSIYLLVMFKYMCIYLYFNPASYLYSCAGLSDKTITEYM